MEQLIVREKITGEKCRHQERYSYPGINEKHLGLIEKPPLFFLYTFVPQNVFPCRNVMVARQFLCLLIVLFVFCPECFGSPGSI
jgi:hypothetical protein